MKHNKHEECEVWYPATVHTRLEGTLAKLTGEERDRMVEETMATVLALPGEERDGKLEALQELTDKLRDESETRLGILEVVRSEIEARPGPEPLPTALTVAVFVRVRELAAETE